MVLQVVLVPRGQFKQSGIGRDSRVPATPLSLATCPLPEATRVGGIGSVMLRLPYWRNPLNQGILWLAIYVITKQI